MILPSGDRVLIYPALIIPKKTKQPNTPLEIPRDSLELQGYPGSPNRNIVENFSLGIYSRGSQIYKQESPGDIIGRLLGHDRISEPDGHAQRFPALRRRPGCVCLAIHVSCAVGQSLKVYLYS
eukprot:977156-Amorphochlora_amoeboformis.AAC.1